MDILGLSKTKERGNGMKVIDGVSYVRVRRGAGRQS